MLARSNNLLFHPKVRCELGHGAVGWTVMLSRISGEEPFNRTFKEYQEGFGNPDAEYWIGNFHNIFIIFQGGSVRKEQKYFLYIHFKEERILKTGQGARKTQESFLNLFSEVLNTNQSESGCTLLGLDVLNPA